jgi:protein-tyrosine phosphatase
MMKRVLMVCLGNICRSPMAEGILKEELSRRGIRVTVDSAGTSGWHAGEPPDERAIDICRKYGVEISGQRSRPFEYDDFDRFDLIFAMDSENYRNVLHLTDDPDDRSKVHLIMNVVHPGSNEAVPDPYYGGSDGFERVYRMLHEASEAIINTWLSDETSEH